jgi:hypothetical protein
MTAEKAKHFREIDQRKFKRFRISEYYNADICLSCLGGARLNAQLLLGMREKNCHSALHVL